jgi:hypothetical protein
MHSKTPYKTFIRKLWVPTKYNIRDFRLLLQCKQDLHSSGKREDLEVQYAHLNSIKSCRADSSHEITS